MQPYTKCLVVEKMLQELKRSPAGASLLWAIAALVVVGGLGAAVAVMSPSTVQSKLEQEAAMRAYYNANSGLNFIYSIERTSEAGGVPYANFLNAVNSGNVVTYPLADGGDFSFQINSLNTNGNNGNYAIDSLVGTVEDASGGKRYSYVIYGGGKGGSATKAYVPVSLVPTPNGRSKYVYAGSSVSTASAYTINGDTYSSNTVSIGTHNTVNGSIMALGNVSLADNITMSGSITTNGTVTTQSDTKIAKGIDAKKTVTLGTRTEVAYVKTGGDVVFTGSGQKVYGDIDAGGNVTIASGSRVEGSIRAGGYVKILSEGVFIKNDVSAKNGVVEISKAEIGGDVYSSGNVTLYSNTTVVDGNVYSFGDVVLQSGTSVLKSVFARGSVSLLASNCSVGINIESGAKVSIGSKGSVGATVIASQQVSMDDAAKISGQATSGSGITLNYADSSIGKDAQAVGIVQQIKGSSFVVCVNDKKDTYCTNCKIGGKVVPITASDVKPTPPKPTLEPLLAAAQIAEPEANLKKIDDTKSYGPINLSGGQTKKFTAGNYYISTITTKWGSIFQFDLSGGDINIFCTGAVDIAQGLNLQVSVDGSHFLSMWSVPQADAAKVYLESYGDISLGYGNEWFGTLFTAGTLTLTRNNIIGMYQSKNGIVNIVNSDTAKVIYVPSNYAMAHWYDTQPTP